MSTTQDDGNTENFMAHVAVDIQGTYPGGEYILNISSNCSDEVCYTANNVQRILLKTFAIFGYPKKITTDNDPQFIANEFTEYLRKNNIEHRRVTPYRLLMKK